MDNLNKIPDTLVEYYDYHSGCICLPLRAVKNESNIKSDIFKLLKMKSEINSKDNKEYNWALEYCIIFDDEVEKNVDGICLRKVESYY